MRRRPIVRTKPTTFQPEQPMRPWEWEIGARSPGTGSTPAARAYENARRAGKTHPEMVELISSDDPRHHNNRGRNKVPNRGDYRAAGYRAAPIVVRGKRGTRTLPPERRVTHRLRRAPHPLSVVAIRARRAEAAHLAAAAAEAEQ